jgi:hypothetical protein
VNHHEASFCHAISSRMKPSPDKHGYASTEPGSWRTTTILIIWSLLACLALLLWLQSHDETGVPLDHPVVIVMFSISVAASLFLTVGLWLMGKGPKKD